MILSFIRAKGKNLEDINKDVFKILPLRSDDNDKC